MNYLKTLILTFISMFFYSIAHEPRMLQKENILRKSSKIKNLINHDKCISYSLATFAAAHELYQWVPLLKSFFANAQVEAPVVEKKTILEALKACLVSFFYTKEGWASIIHSGLSVGGIIMASKICSEFVHPNTLRWYVHAHVPYTVTIESIKKQALQVQNEAIGTIDMTFHKKNLFFLYNRLVEQGESMCAYMTYKSAYLNAEEKTMGYMAARSFFKSYNSWLHRIFTCIYTDSCNYEKLEELLTACIADVDSQLNHFAIIEQETLHDRLIIKKQIRKSIAY